MQRLTASQSVLVVCNAMSGKVTWIGSLASVLHKGKLLSCLWLFQVDAFANVVHFASLRFANEFSTMSCFLWIEKGRERERHDNFPNWLRCCCCYSDIRELSCYSRLKAADHSSSRTLPHANGVYTYYDHQLQTINIHFV